MNEIRMTPEELDRSITDYKNSAHEINQLLTKMERRQQELKSQWKGQASEGFDSQFHALKPKVKQFEQLLIEISGQLGKTKDAIIDHDQRLSQNFGLNG
ncbi:hypothetical protein A374_18811 [Fictibacillus macauensis ZFHKF-1]|uniref:ESAT-6-like protein n=1 Tax=Fictibacillus macauensis ZFHKF-1 TaxID=1196324 RepID=I8U9Z1_9BACL|nr:WXG100 family type VII secretion target [Fictibacillus macauensis]EIT83770.1 hypothetical protein A374_18811 [Fictibacillus macauensis ZFHKF-1]